MPEQHRRVFDFTINIGHLISVGILIVTIVTGYVNIMKEMAEVRTKVDAMWQAYTERGSNAIQKDK